MVKLESGVFECSSTTDVWSNLPGLKLFEELCALAVELGELEILIGHRDLGKGCGDEIKEVSKLSHSIGASCFI